MIFRPAAVEQILAGHKTVTRRLVPDDGVCRYRVGKSYAVQPGRGEQAVARVLVCGIARAPLGEVAHPDELRAEGFGANGDTQPTAIARFEEIWTQLHGSFDPDTAVDRIEFELLGVTE